MSQPHTQTMGALVLAALSWTGATARAEAPPLAITAGFGGAPVSTADPVMLTLSHPLGPGEGRLAVFVGTTDWSDVLVVRGTTAMLTPGASVLPIGTTEVTAYLVTPQGEWRELGRFPLTLTARPAASRALKRALDLAFKAQLAEEHRPDTNAPPRATFQDLSFQAALDANASGQASTRKGSFKIVGTSHREEALRFKSIGAGAPLVDLAAYSIGLGQGAAGLSLGGLSAGSHRHLMNGFQGRGATASLALGRPGQLTLAAVSGSQIVGWDNPLGLDTAPTGSCWATLGLELEPARPGALRLEASLLQGSVLPLANYNQGRGARRRQQPRATACGGRTTRVRVGSDSRPRSPAAASPALPTPSWSPAAHRRRGAHPGRRSLCARRDRRPEPASWRTAAAAPHAQRPARAPRSPLPQRGRANAADQEQNLAGAGVRVGEGVVAARPHPHPGQPQPRAVDPHHPDPPDRPRGESADGQPAGGEGQPGLPLLTYSLVQVRQFGAGLPPNSDFSASHVPDQLSVSHAAACSGSGNRARRLHPHRLVAGQPGARARDGRPRPARPTSSVGLRAQDRLDAGLELAARAVGGPGDCTRPTGCAGWRFEPQLPAARGVPPSGGRGPRLERSRWPNARRAKPRRPTCRRPGGGRCGPDQKAPLDHLFVRWSTAAAPWPQPRPRSATTVLAWQL